MFNAISVLACPSLVSKLLSPQINLVCSVKLATELFAALHTRIACLRTFWNFFFLCFKTFGKNTKIQLGIVDSNVGPHSLVTTAH